MLRCSHVADSEIAPSPSTPQRALSVDCHSPEAAGQRAQAQSTATRHSMRARAVSRVAQRISAVQPRGAAHGTAVAHYRRLRDRSLSVHSSVLLHWCHTTGRCWLCGYAAEDALILLGSIRVVVDWLLSHATHGAETDSLEAATLEQPRHSSLAYLCPSTTLVSKHSSTTRRTTTSAHSSPLIASFLQRLTSKQSHLPSSALSTRLFHPSSP